MSKHPPGPYTLERDGGHTPGCGRYDNIRAADGSLVVDGNWYSEMREDVGPLFAAAPELLNHLEAVLCVAARSEEFIEGERGKGASIEQLYAAGEMPDELVAARAFLAQLKGEQP